MNVRTICLAILYDADSTGYEIRKLSTEGEYSYFIDASYGAIYPALAKLEADKLVTSHGRAAGRQAGQEDLLHHPAGSARFHQLALRYNWAKTNTAANFCCSPALHPNCHSRWFRCG